MKIRFVITFILVVFISSCGNELARNWGGSTTVKLKNKKFVSVNWKENNLWIVTKQIKPSDSLETYEFHEHTETGLFGGTVKIVETRE